MLAGRAWAWAARGAAAAAVFAAVALYWRRIFVFYFPGADEWFLMTQYASLNDGGELGRYLLMHWNQHFVPLFKLFFIAEYRLFGLNHEYYHWVTLALFSLGLLVFFDVVALETGDRPAAAAATVYLGGSVAYYPVLTWMFHHQALLAFLFLGLAMRSVGRAGGGGPWTAYLYAGGWCLAASLSYGMGPAAWPIVSVQYVLKRGRGEEGGLGAPAMLGRLALLWLPAVLFGAAYAVFVYPETGAVASLVEPLEILRSGAALTGNVVLASFGLVPAKVIPWAVRHLLGRPDVGIAIVAYEAAVWAASAAWLGAMGYAVWRGGERARSSALLSAAVVIFTAGLVVVARGRGGEGGLLALTSVPRYNFFPFVGIAMGAGALLSLIADRRGAVKTFTIAALALAAITYQESRLIDEIVAASAPAERGRRELVSFIEAQMRGPGSREILLEPGLAVNAVPYGDLFVLFAEPGDVVLGMEDAVLVLRDHSGVGPDGLMVEAEDVRIAAGGVEFRAASIVRVMLGTIKTGRLGHIHFYMRAERDAEGELICRHDDGSRTRAVFPIEGSAFFKRRVLPCPFGSGAEIALPAGQYAVRDVRVYR